MNIFKPYIIAEIGINHNGNIKTALKLTGLKKMLMLSNSGI